MSVGFPMGLMRGVNGVVPSLLQPDRDQASDSRGLSEVISSHVPRRSRVNGPTAIAHNASSELELIHAPGTREKASIRDHNRTHSVAQEFPVTGASTGVS